MRGDGRATQVMENHINYSTNYTILTSLAIRIMFFLDTEIKWLLLPHCSARSFVRTQAKNAWERSLDQLKLWREI